MFIRKENLRDYLGKYPLTTILIVLNMIVMLYAVLILGVWNNHRVVYDVGGVSDFYLREGELWRLFTYAFFHDGIYHFLFNIFAIIIFSPPVEVMLGRMKYSIFLVSSILLTPFPIILVTSDAGVGASGFIFALLGFYFTLIIFKTIQLDEFNQKLISQFIIFVWVFTFVFSAFNWQVVTIFGHLGGWIAGMIFGFAFMKYTVKADQKAM